MACSDCGSSRWRNSPPSFEARLVRAFCIPGQSTTYSSMLRTAPDPFTPRHCVECEREPHGQMRQLSGDCTNVIASGAHGSNPAQQCVSPHGLHPPNMNKPRIPAAPTRITMVQGNRMQSASWRAPGQTSTQRGYGYKWQQARERFLSEPENVLCVYCKRDGRVTQATVVDHIAPHRGDKQLFWKRTNWQALCGPCHSSEKQRREARGE